MRPAVLCSSVAVALLLATAAPGAGAPAPDLCGAGRPGERCAAGAGRRTPGGGEKISHAGWPAVTGILWQVTDAGGHVRTGGAAKGIPR
jgi:hypothetical protein